MSTYISTALSASHLPELNHARIGHHSITRLVTDAAIVTASTDPAGFAGKNAANELSYSYWQPSIIPATWQLGTGDKGDEEHIDYVGIAAHTLGSTGTSIRWQYKIGSGSWTTRVDASPTDDTPIVMLDELSTNTDGSNGIMHRLSLYSYGGVEYPKIGVVYMGRALKMSRPLYGGHAPATLTPDIESRPNESESGQFIGNSIIRRGMSGSWQWSNLDADWYRENFVPFIEDFASYPAFIAWRPGTFPDECAYIWRDGALPRGTNQGQVNLMSVTLNAQGIGGAQGYPGVDEC